MKSGPLFGLAIAMLALMSVSLISCQTLDANSPSVSVPPSPISETDGDGNAAPTLPKSAGQLAYIGGDGNIYVTTADRTSTIAVTNDATAPFEGIGLSYQRISWSPDGRLAFAAVTRLDTANAQSKLYVTEAPDQPARIVGQSDSHFVIYIYWSPTSCSGQPACRKLAYLIEEEEDIALRLVEVDGNKVKNWAIGFGWPFYFSWAADGNSIVWHTGGVQRKNNEARIALYNLDRDKVETVFHRPAGFLAPAWSPQGDYWLGVSANETVDQLQLFGADESVTLAPVSEGGATFAWSPSGDRVAYALRAGSNERFYGPIHIFDLKTGQSQQITDTGLQVLAFFWDPAGQRLGYITLLTMPYNAEWMQWRVYDLQKRQDRGFKAFNPSFQMSFVISSFNQYAQSHRFWSPDGRYLVYANQDESSRQERVWLIDTWNEDGNNAILVDSGTMGFWSWQ